LEIDNIEDELTPERPEEPMPQTANKLLDRNNNNMKEQEEESPYIQPSPHKQINNFKVVRHNPPNNNNSNNTHQFKESSYKAIQHSKVRIEKESKPSRNLNEQLQSTKEEVLTLNAQQSQLTSVTTDMKEELSHIVDARMNQYMT